MNTNSKRRGLLATVGALATAAALVLGGSVAASAAPTIDPSGNVNLNITKLSTPNVAGTTPTGAAQAHPTGSDPIEGVTFTVQRVTGYQADDGAGNPTGPVISVDLTTNAGWQQAAAISFNAATGDWTLGANPIHVQFAAAASGVTNASGVPQTAGVPSFQGMPIGLYHVEETAAPAGVIPAVPFIVALPMTNPAGTDWMNTVYVYPKNAQTEFTKTVDDEQAYVAGDEIVWTLNGTVPRIAKPGPSWGEITQFDISDTLPAGLEAVAADDVLVEIVDENGAVLETLAAPGDYSINTAGNVVAIVFEDDGLDGLNAVVPGNPGAQVRVTITTTVADSSPVANRVLTNGGATTTLEFTVDGENETLTPPPVESRWSSVSFLKVNPAAAPLPGAIFELFNSKADADAGVDEIYTSEATIADGFVRFNDIRVSDFENGVTQPAATPSAGQADCAVSPDLNADFRVFWIAETQAPNGYELLAQALPVIITSGNQLQQVVVDAAGVLQVNADCSPQTVAAPLASVQNVPDNAGFQLPLTGGMGTLILTLLGVAILAAVLIAARRRRAVEEAAE